MSLLLEAQDLCVAFDTPKGQLRALDNVSLQLRKGETLGLVGESGSGKSTLALTLMRAIAPTAGKISIKGQEITRLSRREMRPFRQSMQMIFQDPYASLDPRMTVRRIIAEPINALQTQTPDQVEARVQALLEAVGLPAEAAGLRPAQFSGGQRQRIAIARAMSVKPEIIIADEPVSALDVSIQAQIVNLLQDIQKRTQIAYLVIAHDLPLVHQIADHILVLYLGRVVEEGPAEAIVAQPRHPYTAALLAATPRIDGAGKKKLILAGDPPSPINRPAGCAFHPRCPAAQAKCRTETPLLSGLSMSDKSGHRAACHFPGTVPPPFDMSGNLSGNLSGKPKIRR